MIILLYVGVTEGTSHWEVFSWWIGKSGTIYDSFTHMIDILGAGDGEKFGSSENIHQTTCIHIASCEPCFLPRSSGVAEK